MTSYPINFSYDRDGSHHEGFAATADEAMAIIRADRGGEWNVVGAELATCEVGITRRSRAEVEEIWADEIAAGWMSVIQVYSGFRAEAMFWRVKEG
jgi:hypothetical protein